MIYPYLDRFPKTSYQIGDIVYKLPQIAKSIHFKDEQYTFQFQKYYIKDGQRPEAVSKELYGDESYYWILFLVNESLRDGLSAWPLGSAALEAQIERVYGNRALLSSLEARNAGVYNSIHSLELDPNKLSEYKILLPITVNEGFNGLDDDGEFAFDNTETHYVDFGWRIKSISTYGDGLIIEKNERKDIILTFGEVTIDSLVAFPDGLPSENDPPRYKNAGLFYIVPLGEEVSECAYQSRDYANRKYVKLDETADLISGEKIEHRQVMPVLFDMRCSVTDMREAYAEILEKVSTSVEGEGEGEGEIKSMFKPVNYVRYKEYLDNNDPEILVDKYGNPLPNPDEDTVMISVNVKDHMTDKNEAQRYIKVPFKGVITEIYDEYIDKLIS